jgi:hypothetical protein
LNDSLKHARVKRGEFPIADYSTLTTSQTLNFDLDLDLNLNLSFSFGPERNPLPRTKKIRKINKKLKPKTLKT